MRTGLATFTLAVARDADHQCKGNDDAARRQPDHHPCQNTRKCLGMVRYSYGPIYGLPKP